MDWMLVLNFVSMKTHGKTIDSSSLREGCQLESELGQLRMVAAPR